MSSDVRNALSLERFASYRRATHNDEVAADRLYEWNIQISAALFEVLSGLEIILRNAIHQRLSVTFGTPTTPWFDVIRLTTEGQETLNKARWLATNKATVPEKPGKVVAELSFGFWRYFFSRYYQAHVWPKLRPIFRTSTVPVRREVIDKNLGDLQVLRNRIAHHEPIFSRDLRADFDNIVQVVRWLNPAAADWILSFSRVEAMLLTRPT